jgi:hypothetical protein
LLLIDPLITTLHPTFAPLTPPLCRICRSDLTCCGDQEAQGYGDGNTFGAGVNAPTLHVGSCTW